MIRVYEIVGDDDRILCVFHARSSYEVHTALTWLVPTGAYWIRMRRWAA